MNILILNRREISDQKWDQCLEKSTNPLPYTLSWYLDIVCEKWVGVVCETENEYLAILPIPLERKWKRNFVRQPLFCQQLGLFFSKELEESVLMEIAECTLKTSNYINPYVFNASNEGLLKYLTSSKLNLDQESNHVLPLNKSYDQLFLSFRRDRKKDLKAAKNIEQTIVQSNDIKTMIDMFEKSVRPKFKAGIHPQSYSFLKQIFLKTIEEGIGYLYYTQYKDGSMGASCFFVIWENRIIYLFNASYDEKRKDNGRMLILDYIIKKYSQTSHILDFESPLEEDNIREFYGSFGAEEEQFSKLRYENLPFVISIVRKTRRLFFTKK